MGYKVHLTETYEADMLTIQSSCGANRAWRSISGTGRKAARQR